MVLLTINQNLFNYFYLRTYPGGGNSGSGQAQQQQWVRASGYNESKSYNYGADETSSPSSNAALLSTKERLQRLGYSTGYGGLNVIIID